jgi:IS30 family transposase
MVTLVERQTRYVLLAKMANKDTHSVVKALIRPYFPKGTDLSRYSQAQLNKVAHELNKRPRKTLDYETPTERFNACVAATG